MIDKKDSSGIIFSCFSDGSRAGELLLKEHILCYIISGSIEAFDGARKHSYHKGNLFLYKRNTLTRFSKYPADGVPYKSISVILDREFLLEFNKQNNQQFHQERFVDESVFSIPPDNLLLNFLTSLLPWFDEKIPQQLVNLKKQEAVLLILRNQPHLKDVLFDYTNPGKIDLEAFMNQNFKFNIELPELAYLSGRSLASFKRDFEKIFNMSPHRWAQIKRLQEAHYLLSEKKMKPNDVYIEVGFESLSHFSFAFKKYFGQNPSTI
jgi:AraC-like DNA-binding protein